MCSDRPIDNANRYNPKSDCSTEPSIWWFSLDSENNHPVIVKQARLGYTDDDGMHFVSHATLLRFDEYQLLPKLLNTSSVCFAGLKNAF